MNRSILLVFFIFILFALSCKEDVIEYFEFDIQGVDSVKSNVGDTKALVFSVVRTKGVAEQVELVLKGVPTGVTSHFSTVNGAPNFTDTLSLTITTEADLGSYPLTIEATSAGVTQYYPFTLVISDDLSLSMVVYDATQWTKYIPNVHVDSATVKLYGSDTAFANNCPTYTGMSNAKGVILFYRMAPGNYSFIVSKGALSNVVDKKLIEGKSVGFETVMIFNFNGEIYASAQRDANLGDIKYRDQNADEKITDSDRVQHGVLSIYAKALNNKSVWIGK